MRTVDIMESIVTSIEKTIFEEWKHEGHIGGFTSYSANFRIDGKDYELILSEIEGEEDEVFKKE